MKRKSAKPAVAPPRVFEIFVHGTPAPQGSKRHVGHGILIESSKKVGPWREAVRDQIQRYAMYRLEPLTGPLRVEATFHLRCPKKPKHDAPITYPDLDKLLRSTFDGMVMGGLIEDDSHIVAVVAVKVYAEHADGVGVSLKVEELRRL